MTGNRRPSGEIRQSQVVTTFGPGAMIDLPKRSIIVGGLNHWRFDNRTPIHEERLTNYIARMLQLPQISLYAPPVDEDRPDSPRTGITAFVFPTWFLAQEDRAIVRNGKTYRTRPLIRWSMLNRGNYLNEDRKSIPVVPIRFVQACLNGHISDIDWHRFVQHRGNCTNRGALWFDEGASSNDFSEIFVRCERCGAIRPLADASVSITNPAGTLGRCAGHRPWLGPSARENCISQRDGQPEWNRLLVRSASNSYFAQVVSAISIPDTDAELRQAVDEVYEDYLQYLEEITELQKERRKQRVANAIAKFSDAIVWNEVQRRKHDQPIPDRSLKQLEIETLLAQPYGGLEDDIPNTDFYARAFAVSFTNRQFQTKIDRVVLVHRLREVVAQVGFTRIEPALIDIDGELSLDVRRANLDMDITWLPACENRGEGIFISFSPEAIYQWCDRSAVKERGQQLWRGFSRWAQTKGITINWRPSLPYIMLHSLSHLLINAVSLECGYSASAIRERIYAIDSKYGILLYTGSTGSEGTLGGLIEVGKNIDHYLAIALEMGRLCSNDPVCSQHQPESSNEERYLHGAACHSCLLISETSCERRNELLDRALVVKTVSSLGAEFFD